MDFIGFTYNGYHSIRDLNIYRTSNGSRYDENLTATMTDKTADVPGGDGQYYFGTQFKNRTFNVSYAFDNLSESGIAKLKEVFSGDGVHDLVFDEAPYKVWGAKVTGTASLKHLCFEQDGERVYKGEGSITFTCYYPYAHTPTSLSKPSIEFVPVPVGKVRCGIILSASKDINNPRHFLQIFSDRTITVFYRLEKDGVWGAAIEKNVNNKELLAFTTRAYIEYIEIPSKNGDSETQSKDTIHFTINNKEPFYYTTDNYFAPDTNVLDGRNINNYLLKDFPNKMEWALASGLGSNPVKGENFGNLPSYFTATTDSVAKGQKIEIGSANITILEACNSFSWDSKTGIVKGSTKQGEERPIPYSGNSIGTIPVGQNSIDET